MSKVQSQYFVNLSNIFNRNDLKGSIQKAEETYKQGLKGFKEIGKKVKKEKVEDERDFFSPKNLKSNVEAITYRNKNSKSNIER